LLALTSSLFIDYKSQIVRQVVSQRLQGPSWQHFFGTDQYGRDIFLRVLYGARYSLSVGIVAVFCLAVIGGTLGVIAGYSGGCD
jgi:peptide/nickel transport system permease protein